MAERTLERLQYHLDVEHELADKLRNATKAQRKSLYTEVYDELFRRVTDHPQLTEKVTPEKRKKRIIRQMRCLRPLIGSDGTFVEVGPGDCGLSLAMCKHARSIFAVDVSNEISRRNDLPPNFALKISDGVSVPVDTGSVDLTYSDQLMEHLHPDDAADQLREIARILKPGGVYLCVTPNKYLGPHDVTRYFEYDISQGLHLVEYGYADLDALLAQAGFRRRYALFGSLGLFVKVPVRLAIALERIFQKVSPATRRRLRRNKATKALLNVVFGGRVLAVRG